MSVHEAAPRNSHRAIALTIDRSHKRSRCIDYTAPFRLEVESKPARRRPARRFARTAAPAGAVRLDALAAAGRGSAGHGPKVAAGLVLVAGGILVTTTSIGRVTPASEEARIEPVAARHSAPAFFFDDTSDALGGSSRVSLGDSIGNTLGDVQAESDSGAVARLSATAESRRPDVAPAVAPVESLDERELASVAVIDPVTRSEARIDAHAGALAGALSGARSEALAEPLAALARPAATSSLEPAAEPDREVAAATSGGEAASAESTPTKTRTLDYVIARGDTLSGVLNDHGVKIERMPPLLENDIVKTHLSNLEIGQVLQLTKLANGDFHSVKTKVGSDLRVTIRSEQDGFAIAAIDLPVERERVVSSGTIDQSLYIAAEQAELKQSTIMSLADIFQWELDFARDIRQGDQFSVVYDRLYREGKYIGDGEILAAEFVRGGKTHRAIRFTDENGRSGYYAPDGTSKRRTFLRHPVDVVRITSKFDPERLHPVLHQIRAHRGVDYGAPHGSPIRATADGVVRFSGAKNAYGNTVILQHGDSVKTLYAHMSRISDKSSVGARVAQGDVIGYVGNSGRVTGTHLHYEFRVDEKHVDPLTVEFPAAEPLESRHLDALGKLAGELTAQMRTADADSDSLVAATTPRSAGQ